MRKTVLSYGDCMRFPPESNREYSQTYEYNWCGEYKKKENINGKKT